MKKRKYKQYQAGDQINIAVTKDFAPVAEEFFRFCEEHQFNPSEVIRTAIANWLEDKKKLYGINERKEEIVAERNINGPEKIFVEVMKKRR